MEKALNQQHHFSCLGIHQKKLILLLVVVSIILLACNSTEEEEEVYIPVSNLQTSVTLDDMLVTGIGQYTGFNTNGDVVELYPYYDKDYKVNIRKILISNNNFWYDFVCAQGYTMSNIKFYPTGIMTLTTGTATYGYYAVNDTTAIFAYSYELPGSYINLALNHTTVNTG